MCLQVDYKIAPPVLCVTFLTFGIISIGLHRIIQCFCEFLAVVIFLSTNFRWAPLNYPFDSEFNLKKKKSPQWMFEKKIFKKLSTFWMWCIFPFNTWRWSSWSFISCHSLLHLRDFSPISSSVWNFSFHHTDLSIHLIFNYAANSAISSIWLILNRSWSFDLFQSSSCYID